MATAFAVGSLLAKGAAAASAAGTIGATGVAGIGFGTLSAGLGIAGQVFGGLQQMQAAEAAGEAEAIAARSRAIEVETQAAREETQAELEALEREKTLRSVLAQQRARFGGAGVDPFSGSPLRISEVTESEIKRQDRQAGLFSALTVSSLNKQAEQERLAGRAAKSAAQTRGRTALFTSLSGAAKQFGQVKSLIK